LLFLEVNFRVKSYLNKLFVPSNQGKLEKLETYNSIQFCRHVGTIGSRRGVEWSRNSNRY